MKPILMKPILMKPILMKPILMKPILMKPILMKISQVRPPPTVSGASYSIIVDGMTTSV